jgi:hypothetical protein
MRRIPTTPRKWHEPEVTVAKLRQAESVSGPLLLIAGV